ncbi:alpha/beta hydrolase [Halalkalibacter kiskunsagensis]|uniref:Alpha/beta hydrolase n=1 Tax=Halalkalibacter kiskunsagensis TaxID=1548599 RepID=A0ABV6KH44_9BACI
MTHGFIGTPQSVRFLGEKLAEEGYSVYGPRLKGHGTHYKDLAKATRNEWFGDVERGYRVLVEHHCSSIFIIGQSMGGTLALWLGNKYPEIKGLILINAALTVPSYEYLIGKVSPNFVYESGPDIKQEGVHEITYNKIPVFAIHELQALMNNTLEILPTIKHPVLCFKSIEDHVVPPGNTDFILKQVQSNQKEVYTLKNSYHVASLDYEKETIVREVNRLIKKQLKSNPLKKKRESRS